MTAYHHLAVSTIAFVMSVGLGWAADPPPGLKSLFARNGPVPMPQGPFLDHRLYLYGPVMAVNGEQVAGGLTLSPEYLKHPLGADVYIQYPPLREGDLVPAFGYLYRAGLPTAARADGGGWHYGLRLTAIPADKVPKGAAVGRETFAIVLAGDDKFGYGHLQDHRVYVRAIDPAPAVGTGGSTARLEVWPPTADLRTSDGSVKLAASVQIGDLLLLARPQHPVAHRVAAIVLPDPKNRVLGWVEFDPKPLPEKELKPTDPIVRPAAKK